MITTYTGPMFSGKSTGLLNKYETSIIIRTEKSDNILVNIISMASTSNVNVQTLNIINNTDFQTYNLVVLVDNIDRLNSFLNALYQMKEIIEVQRIINWELLYKEVMNQKY